MARLGGLEIRLIDESEESLIREVIDLGDSNRRWLGLLSEAAYRDYVRKGGALVALHKGSVVGYALFYLPRDQVRLAQLCVAPEARGQDVARQLVEKLSTMHAQRQGIRLRCRDDFPAAKVWPNLGFYPVSNAPGRSSKGHALTAWWLNHGHPDLFAVGAEDRSLVPVALDSNVFRDLYENGRGPGAAQSQALQAPWLADEIELVVTPGLQVELNDVSDDRTRRSLLNHATAHRVLAIPASETDSLFDEIMRGLGAEILERDASLRPDARLLAEAITGGATAFVTRDQTAADCLAPVAAPLADTWVSTPTDLIVHLDELRDAAAYSPSRLLDSGYTISEAPADAEGELRPLLNNAAGERLSEFRLRVRSAAQFVGHTGARKVLRDPAGVPCAGAFWRMEGNSLEVSLLRVVPSSLATTIATQLAHLIRVEALERQLRRVTVTDRYLTENTRAVLMADGYLAIDSGALQARVVPGCLEWIETRRLIPELDLPTDGDSTVPAGVRAAELERVLRPLKIRDADLKCYLVPIRPGPATALFGREETLWGRDPGLGLSREHVYYRAPRPRIQAPSRILWYVSGTQGQVVAASRLEHVDYDRPRTLHRRYRRLGVLMPDVIERSASKGIAQALLFADTEFFEKPVTLKRLLEIDGGLRPLPSPRAISARLFFKVYEEGDPR